MYAKTLVCYFESTLLWKIVLGLFVSASFVNQCSSAPYIYDVGTVLYEGRLWIVGTVEDPDEDSTGATVFVEGDIDAAATIFEDNMFRILVPFSGSFGFGAVQSVGHDGELSNVVEFEFYE